jgi:hypothetical protein
MKDSAPLHKLDHNNGWVIVTFKEPVLWTRSDHEVWMFNPGQRYVLNANQLTNLEKMVDSISDLKSSANHRPLLANNNVAQSRILVERYRDRGIGDLLFMTGPLAYLQNVSGHSCKIDMYALADRSQVMLHNPLLQHKGCLAGPTIYDSLVNYDFHWFADVVTEYDTEKDQLNVYDALYKQIGVDYAKVDPKYKRPSAVLSEADLEDLDTLFFYIHEERQFDLRKTGYYVVAPLSHGSLRTMPYKNWLDVIAKLAEQRPVVVIGALTEKMPMAGMSVGEFYQRLHQVGPNVINMIGSTPLRSTMALISKAIALVCLDSGPLYIAQALRTPAISIWGPHHPGVRIGYDKDYMDLAIWHKENCRFAPCFAFSRFPASKCPERERQSVCEVLKTPGPDDVLAKLQAVEGRRNISVGAIAPAK